MKLIVLSALVALATARPQLSQEASDAAIKQIQHDISQPIVPDVPGIAAHQAAVDAVLAAQGRNPGLNRFDALVAKQQQAEVRHITYKKRIERKKRRS